VVVLGLGRPARRRQPPRRRLPRPPAASPRSPPSRLSSPCRCRCSCSLERGRGRPAVLTSSTLRPQSPTRRAWRFLPGPRRRSSCGGLTFAYEPGGRNVLDAIDLTVAAGTCVAIVGPSGSGKSTLVSLLLRFYEPSRGEICIDGRDVRELRADDVRRLLGVVSQRVDLFDSTIRDNLALADPDVSDDAMEAACRVAQLHDVVAALPDGYNTRIGADGHQLSGGERRRLAIARAIIKKAPILILDEATADLDAVTEERLVASLRPFVAGRTTLVISHRPALVNMADAVVELRGGRLRTVRDGPL
jgi:ABC-type multidrug transport system fused ATPase/permease subunit